MDEKELDIKLLWSERDQQYVAHVATNPFFCALGDTPEECMEEFGIALRELLDENGKPYFG